MSESDLVKRARELLVGVTEGPWMIDEAQPTRVVSRSGTVAFAAVQMGTARPLPRWIADAKMVAASRTLVPELLEALEAAEAERDAMREALSVLHIDCGSHGCMFAKEKGGMRVNGPCQCLEDIRPSSRRRDLTHLIRAARAALKGPDNADG